MQNFWQDLRYAARMLWRYPGFTLIAVFTLALGIGASTAIFSAVNPLLFEPLPYPNAGQVAMIWDRDRNRSRADVTFGTYRELVERSQSFDALAVFKRWQPTLTGPAEPERLDGQRVSASYFHVLGVPPALGREFDSSEDKPNAVSVVILSNGLWKRRFGADETIIGRQIKLDDNSYTVIGVMPSSFENVLSPSVEIWTSLQYDMTLPVAWGHHLRMVGRLRAAVEMNQAGRELDTIAHRQLAEFPRQPWASLQDGLIVNQLQDDVTSGVGPALLGVLGAVLLVLIIACVNVTNLLLARGAQRQGEIAVRAALGAGRARLIQQLLVESLLLALAGGGLGMMVVGFGVNSLVALSPPGLPRAGAIRIDGSVLAFGIGLTTLIGVAVGFIPAFHASRSDLHLALQQSSRRTVGGHQVTRRSLVVAEVALTLVLLVSTGLLLRSLRVLFAIAPGFEASNLLTMQVQTSGHRFDDAGITHRFFEQALEAVSGVSGVTSAAFTSQLPLSGDLDEYGAHFEFDDPETGYNTFRYAVSPGYFETMGIPLRRGRLLDGSDTAGAPLAVVISESLARSKFSEQDPIGRRLRVGPNDGPWYTIVGVVGDVRQASLAASQSDAVYTTAAQWRFADNSMSLVVRTRSDDASLAPEIRNAIWSVDKDQPIVRIARMGDLIAASAGARRFALTLFEAFGLVSLVLASIGIYGVLSRGVTERTPEIGIRLALGAPASGVLELILWQGMKPVLAGVCLGLLASIAVTRLLESLLFNVSATDPATFAVTALLLAGVALVACYLPARRAMKIDPMVALRCE